MRVLVTGGAGFIGSHVVDQLVDLGHTVAVVDNLSTGSSKNIRNCVKFYEADIREQLAPVFAETMPEVVIHLAAQVSVSASVGDPVNDAAINLGGTVNIVDLARQAGVRKVVAFSSAAVYSHADSPIREDYSAAPRSPYGLSKWAGEQYIRLLCGQHNLQFTILRPANVFGPRQIAQGEGAVVPALLQQFLKRDGRPIIHGAGAQVRDFIFVEDVATAVAKTLELADGLTLNLSSGIGTTITDLWFILASLVGWTSPPIHGKPRDGDIPYSVLDNSLAQHALSWVPRTTLKTGLEETVGWLRTHAPELVSSPGT